jgi:hypothetical protein
MKINLKNTEFKRLYEWMELQCMDGSIENILEKTLKPQYDKAFNKYQAEKQAFKPKEKVKFRFYTKTWTFGGANSRRVENTDWIDGFIYKVSRLASGQYRYIIAYEDDDMEGVVGKYRYTNPLTKKNISTR